jgi:thiamine pyrophosphokinase
MPKAVVVFAGAPLQPVSRLLARLAALETPYVIAADSGAATALAFGLQPDLVIGDLDSLDSATRSELLQRGVPFETYPRAKDATDSQLALARALQEAPEQLLLLGLLNGPRLDMTVANVLLLGLAPSRTAVLDEDNEAVILLGPDQHNWHAQPQELISLLPLGGDVEGVTTSGLLYTLSGETLKFGDSRGVSNEPVDANVAVALENGRLLIVRHFPRL